GESICAVIAFAPPAIEDAQIEATMAAGFHAAGARRFQWPSRCVQPNVAACSHLPGHVHVVIFNEHQVALKVAILAEVNDILDVTFAMLITRMSFAGENELNG